MSVLRFVLVCWPAIRCALSQMMVMSVVRASFIQALCFTVLAMAKKLFVRHWI